MACTAAFLPQCEYRRFRQLQPPSVQRWEGWTLGSNRDTRYRGVRCRHSGPRHTQHPITWSARKSNPTTAIDFATFEVTAWFFLQIWISDGNIFQMKELQTIEKAGIRITQAHPTPHILHASFLEWDGRIAWTLENFSSTHPAAKLIGSVCQDYAITLSHGQLPELTQDLCAHAVRGKFP